MNKHAHFLGLRTVIYGVSDIEEAKRWYSEVLGIDPYFDQPFYVGFNVAGFELGLDPNIQPIGNKHMGVVAYWGVENIEQEHQRLLGIGAKGQREIEEVGDGIKVATFSDPFGNVFGIIYNRHFMA